MNKVNGCRMDKGARIPPKAFPCGRLDLCSRNQIGSSSCKIFDKNYNTFYNLWTHSGRDSSASVPLKKKKKKSVSAPVAAITN